MEKGIKSIRMNTNDQNFSARMMGDEVQMLRKKIQTETNKSNSHDEKINDIKVSIKAAKQRLQEKKQKLAIVNQKVIEEKYRGQQAFEASEESSNNTHNQGGDSSPSISNSNIMSQLREHFKAIRMQMMAGLQGYDDDDNYEDQVDVDNMTYEELLELGEKIGKVSKGLDDKKIQALQVKKYRNQNKSQSIECVICREELEEGVQCIELQCAHIFHQDCIKGWLNVEKQCPNCKREIKFDDNQVLTKK